MSECINPICDEEASSAYNNDYCSSTCEIMTLRKERDKYRKALEEIAPMCGNPNAVDDCRLILNKCQEVLESAIQIRKY